MKNIQGLPHPDNKHLDAVEGWLELGNWKEANAELELIKPQFQAHPFVLEISYKIHEAAGRPEMAMKVARELTALLPDYPLSHIHLAFSLHELKRTKAAYDTLIPVIDQFPDEWVMRYNLACYSCQLGNLNEAMQWLKKATALAGKKEIRLMALEDADLKPLWTQIERI